MRKLALLLLVANVIVAIWYWLLPKTELIFHRHSESQLNVAEPAPDQVMQAERSANSLEVTDQQLSERAPRPSGMADEELVVQLRHALQRLQPRVEATSGDEVRGADALQGSCVVLQGARQEIDAINSYWQSKNLTAELSQEEQVLSQLFWVVDQSAETRAQAQEITAKAVELWQDAALTSGFDNPYSVSLGVFSSEENASSRRQSALDSGFQAKTIVRSRTVRRFQLLVLAADWQAHEQDVRTTWPEINFNFRSC